MKRISILIMCLFVLASCRSQELIQPGDSLEVAFEKAYSLYEQERYRDAINAFETVLSIGRGTDVGQDAQYYLAESYFNNNQFLLAAAEYERYSDSHPGSQRREDVDYKAAYSYYRMSPRYNIDQANTRRSIERFRLFLARHPNSEQVDDASSKIEEMRDKLARKTFESAEFYMRNNQYRSAVIYFDLVVDRYPETRWAERALAKQVEGYILYADNSIPSRQQERYQQAVDSYETYLQLFPRGENRSRVEDLYDRAREALSEFEDSSDPVTAR